MEDQQDIESRFPWHADLRHMRQLISANNRQSRKLGFILTSLCEPAGVFFLFSGGKQINWRVGKK